MRSGVRVTVIGGGSSYTPELIDGFIRHAPELPVETITLVDVPEGADKMQAVGELARRMLARAGLTTTLNWTLERRPALAEADFVCFQFRVGGLAARERDERIALSHGAIGQETVGAGGFAKALRTVPVALELAEELTEVNPRAWILNFTNPSGMVTEALLKYSSLRTIGLCNVPINLQAAIARLVEAERDDIRLEMFGLNHLSFVRRIWWQGRDLWPTWLSELEEHWPRLPQQPFSVGLIRAVGLIPNDYLKYYWLTGDMLDRQLADYAAGKGTRATEVMALEASLFQKYRDPALTEAPPELSQRGGALYSEVAVTTMVSLATNRAQEMVVNVRNGTTLADLPPDAAVEVSCLVDGRGARPLVQEPMPLTVRGLVQQVKSYERMTIEAAVTGNRDLALAALINNPLVPSAGCAEAIWADILRLHAAYLPRF